MVKFGTNTEREPIVDVTANIRYKRSNLPLKTVSLIEKVFTRLVPLFVTFHNRSLATGGFRLIQ